MNSIRSIKELNKRELEQAVSTGASWHNDYRDTAFIYVGGLPFQLSEGDIVTIFSQYGEPNYINLVRDKETGKSKGFCFLKYEDQRSCDLAVDNLGGATVMGRLLSVDHTRYKPKDDEKIVDNTRGETEEQPEQGREQSESEEEERPLLKEERELQRLKLEHDDDDPMKGYLIEQKQDEVKAALERYERDKQKSSSRRPREHRHRHRHQRSDKNRDERRHRHERDRSRSKSPRRGRSNSAGRERRRNKSGSPVERDGQKRHHERRRYHDRSESRERRPRDGR